MAPTTVLGRDERVVLLNRIRQLQDERTALEQQSMSHVTQRERWERLVNELEELHAKLAAAPI